MVNYQEAFEKPFTDIKKLLIGIALSILPLISWFARGYILECSGTGKNKSVKKMPEWAGWKNFGSYFVKGFIYYIIALIYLLPAIMVFIFGAGKVIYSLAISIPWQEVQQKTSDEAAALIQPIIQDAMPALKSAFPYLIISIVLGILALYILPIAALSYLNENNLSGAFRIKKIFKKSFTGKYFVAVILMLLVALLLGSLLGVIPFVGKPAAAFIISVIAYSLFGQIYLETNKKIR